MRILVTGAAGFIGFHVISSLLAKEYKVVGLDNINDYYDPKLKYARLLELGIGQDNVRDGILISSLKYPRFRFIKSDVVDLATLSNLFQECSFDQVIHLAAQPGARYSIDHPHDFVQSNLVGFVNVLECCRHHTIQHLVYASSSSVYGSNTKVPFHESDRVDHPVSLYAATKKSNELLAHVYSHTFQVPTTGLRFFTVYGPWGRPDMAPMLFADAMLTSKPIKVFNNGELERDFTYVDDIVEGVVRVLDRAPNEDSRNPFYRILNIGNSKPVRLMDFIAVLEKELGCEAVKEFLPMQSGDVKVTYADSNCINNLTEYKPKVSIEEGIRSYVSWYKKYFAVNV